VIYEVVYSQVVDNLVNDQGQSVSKSVTLPYPINQFDSTEIATVYPNSLINMRDQVIDTVGQISNILPRWMLSKQADGKVLGFVPAWVIAYCKPGKSGQVAYNIAQQYGDKLNLVDFEVDRYELDRLLTHNWNPTVQRWVGTEPDTYSNTDSYDQYLVFPRRTIISPVIVDPNPNIPVNWLNNSAQVVEWNNDSDQPVGWKNF